MPQITELWHNATKNLLQGVATVYMGLARDAYGSSKLGKHIVGNIANALQGTGLGYYPDLLPSY